MHGIDHVFSKKSFKGRLFWGVLVLVSIGFAVYFTYQLVSDFMKFETDWSYTIEISQSLTFPVVTICNGMRLYSFEKGAIFTEGFQHYAKKNTKFCKFSNKPCGEMNMTYSTIPGKTPCIKFNAAKKLPQLVPSGKSGLNMEFFINRSDVFQPNDIYKESVEQVANIYIHSSATYVYLGKSQIKAKLGYSTQYIIKKVKVLRLKSPYTSHCTDDNKKSLSYYPGNYTVFGCFLTQWSIDAYKQCGYVVRSLRPYFPYKKYKKGNFYTGCLDKLPKRNFKCPLPCFEERYEIKASSETKWPLEPELSQLRKDVGEQNQTLSDEYIYSSFG